MNNFTFLRYKKRLSSNRQKEDSLTLIICLEVIYNFWISSGNNPVAFWIVSVSNPIDFRFRAISIHPSIFPSMRPSNFTPSTRHFVSWWHSGVRHKHSVLQETYYNKSVFYELPSNREPGCQNGYSRFLGTQSIPLKEWLLLYWTRLRGLGSTLGKSLQEVYGRERPFLLLLLQAISGVYSSEAILSMI